MVGKDPKGTWCHWLQGRTMPLTVSRRSEHRRSCERAFNVKQNASSTSWTTDKRTDGLSFAYNEPMVALTARGRGTSYKSPGTREPGTRQEKPMSMTTRAKRERTSRCFGVAVTDVVSVVVVVVVVAVVLVVVVVVVVVVMITMVANSDGADVGQKRESLIKYHTTYYGMRSEPCRLPLLASKRQGQNSMLKSSNESNPREGLYDLGQANYRQPSRIRREGKGNVYSLRLHNLLSPRLANSYLYHLLHHIHHDTSRIKSP
ncbi:hypothetical protein HZH68_008301 [Vespula germanica]|uniref:Uncharacterized protein n=1 Tax=Vespula germanica TaxID=30212 RepID=A0A834N9D0_VESGE|nr:hypothetical protein HZH68_008301 [Vespula germanica]